MYIASASVDELVKSLFASDFEHFGVKAIEMFGVKKC
jgi:hypothetical protein